MLDIRKNKADREERRKIEGELRMRGVCGTLDSNRSRVHVSVKDSQSKLNKTGSELARSWGRPRWIGGRTLSTPALRKWFYRVRSYASSTTHPFRRTFAAAVKPVEGIPRNFYPH